jgi:hypothetical protein
VTVQNCRVALHCGGFLNHAAVMNWDRMPFKGNYCMCGDTLRNLFFYCVLLSFLNGFNGTHMDCLTPTLKGSDFTRFKIAIVAPNVVQQLLRDYFVSEFNFYIYSPSHRKKFLFST